MSQIITPSTIEIRFNNLVNNIKAIIREGRHMDVAYSLRVKLPVFVKFIDDVNFKVSFLNKDEQEDYIKARMLDAMDFILDEWVSKYTKESTPNAYRVVNSIYDAIKEFYFEED